MTTPSTERVDRFVWWIPVVLVLILGSFLRLYDLGHKTMMHDELLFSQYSYYYLYESWTYTFFPILHGPLMLHIQNLIYHVLGATDYTVRLGAALLGVASLLLLLFLRPFMGRTATLAALTFLAISPGIVFFSRFLHMDSLYLFFTMLIVVSSALWVRLRLPIYLVLAIVSWFGLFSTKSSAVFLAFTFITFFMILLVHDLSGRLYIIRQAFSVRSICNLRLIAIAFVLWLFCLIGFVNVLEGVKFDNDVIDVVGYDSPLKNSSILRSALSLKADSSLSYLQAIAVLVLSFGASLLAVLTLATNAFFQRDLESISSRITRHFVAQWLYVVIAFCVGYIFYHAIYTTFFYAKIGPFEIYRRTFSYWSGQHAWGRISGPFHLHLLNIIIYELPAFLLLIGASIGLPKSLRITPRGSVVFLITAVCFIVIDKLIFAQISKDVPRYLGFVFLAILAVLASFTLHWKPTWFRPIAFVYLFLMIIVPATYFISSNWQTALELPTKRSEDSSKTVLFSHYLESTFNIDGGWNIILIMVMIFLSLLWIWNLLRKGDVFRAFVIWWFLTMFGAASYAREAVPQVGIHAMLPLLILAGMLIGDLHRIAAHSKPRQIALYAVLGLILLWTFRVSWQLNFVYPNDPRERFAYAPTANDIREDMELIVRYHESVVPPEARGTDRRSRSLDPVRIGSQPISHVGLPAKWYLRELNYFERSDAESLIAGDYEFLFLEARDLEYYDGLLDRYQVRRGSSTTFWIPPPIYWHEVRPIFGGADEEEKAFAWEKIRWVWRYFLYRELPVDAEGDVPGYSSFDYLFCVRNDLIIP